MGDKQKKAALWALAAALAGGTLWVLWTTGFFAAAGTREGLEAYLSRWAPWSQAAFFGVQLASVIAAPIPSNLTAAAGGWLFGLWPAFLLSWGAVTAGSLLVFALARGLGRDFARRLAEGGAARYWAAVRRKRDAFLLVAFLFPLFPDDLLCILAGLTDIPFRRFALLAALARPWGLLAACAVGSSALTIPWWGTALLALAGLALGVLVLRYGDRAEEAVLRRLEGTAGKPEETL